MPIRRPFGAAMEMPMDDKISVIVPIYNISPWIQRCVSSIQNQTYDRLEIILVDDGSSDDSLDVCQTLAAEDDRIKVLHKENGGLASARLAGIDVATGEWLTFVDGDDEIERDMYQRLISNAHQYNADISHCGYVMLYPDGRRIDSNTSGLIRVQDRFLGLKDLLEEDLIQPSVCTKIYKRALFCDLEGKYTEDIWNNEDFLLNFYLFSKSRTSVFEAFCPYHYCLRDGSLSRRKPNAHTIYDPILVKERILPDCPPELLPDLRRATANTCLFAYAQLCRGMGREYAADRKKVREWVRRQLPFCSVLSLKNAAMVWIVSYIPWLFHGIYGVYYRLKKR